MNPFTVSSSWIWPIIASIGGLIVFWGLWMEKIAEKDSKNISVFRRRKWMAKWGWRVLMFGIAAEVVLGFALAWKDEIEEAKNDPRNQSIKSVTAHALLVFSEANFPNARPQDIYLMVFGDIKTNTPTVFLTADFLSLPRHVPDVPVGSDNIVQLDFRVEAPWANIPGTDRDLTNKWDVITLNLPPFAGCCGELTMGILTITVNSDLSRTYFMPRQKPGLGFKLTIIATNGQCSVPDWK